VGQQQQQQKQHQGGLEREREGGREGEREKGERHHCVIGKGKLTAQHKIYVHIDASFQNFFPLSVNIVTIGTF
jgi:hypothetical protein